MAVVGVRLALGLVLLVGVGTAAAASGAPAASEKTYVDERAEDVGAPEIASVVVSNDDAGLIAFRLITPNRARLGSSRWPEPALGSRSGPLIYSGVRYDTTTGYDLTGIHQDRAPSRHPRTWTYVATFGSA